MKTVPEILNTLDKKIKEHTNIIEAVDFDIKSMKSDNSVENASKRLILKDKILFHRAAVLALKDLKDSING